MKTPLITEIQRFSLQDGPGIRSTIFIKGCPLHCPWCHNPETQDAQPEFYYYPDKCTRCGKCVEVCQSGATSLSIGPNKQPELNIDRKKCVRCMQCVEACLYGARTVVGKSFSIAEIVQEVLSDRLFYGHSGGGVTISGGEPLMYPEFTLNLARALKEEGLDVAIETSCFQKWARIAPLVQTTDLFIVDIKSFDPQQHKKVIGKPLEPILDNIQHLIAIGANVRIHFPIIPDFNDLSSYFEQCLSFIDRFQHQLNGVDILRYHVYGEKKYDLLGRGDTYTYKNVKPCISNELLMFAKALKRFNHVNITFDGIVGIKPNK
ncbi:glycyl-radical enzyme activating protein [Desulfosarcina cetonica]|uniref:glycyl-radical enzyme activating protein n=1 Tax=Desulfosarcina cetonica TaxID=90730 RepID=UPI0006D1A41E|nr:glycyl-radical enzyme activating protein [Desulfosarcina cetonica]